MHFRQSFQTTSWRRQVTAHCQAQGCMVGPAFWPWDIRIVPQPGTSAYFCCSWEENFMLSHFDFGHRKLCKQTIATDPLSWNLKAIHLKALFLQIRRFTCWPSVQAVGINQMRGSLTLNLSGHHTDFSRCLSQSLFGPEDILSVLLFPSCIGPDWNQTGRPTTRTPVLGHAFLRPRLRSPATAWLTMQWWPWECAVVAAGKASPSHHL